MQKKIAFYSLLAGIVGASAAAVPGFIDWWSITDKAVKRIADWHARLNVIALLVFIANFYLRTTSGSAWVSGSYAVPVLLSIAGIVFITISGGLGGQMVYVHGVAVERQAETKPEETRKVRAAGG
jgi:uncharacterized membrane protein